MVGRIGHVSCLEPCLEFMLRILSFSYIFYLHFKTLPTTYYVKQKMLLSDASLVHLFTTSLILDLHRKTIDIFLTLG